MNLYTRLNLTEKTLKLLCYKSKNLRNGIVEHSCFVDSAIADISTGSPRVPRGVFLSAKALIFFAAFISLSCIVPQLAQAHPRFSNFKIWLEAPQAEQVLLLGSNLPICTMFFPLHSALYRSIETKVDHPESEILCARVWFLTIPETLKSSMQTVWLSLISLEESLCKKSFRWFAIFSCSNATLCRALFLFAHFFIVSKKPTYHDV